jgi:bla regulator protein BlaR1
METAQLILEALGRASLQGAAAIGVVWLVCRLFPRLPASLRCGLWWLASLKLLIALVWIEPIPLPLLPAPEPAPVAAVAFSSPSPGGSGVRVGEGERGGEGPQVAEASVLQTFPWAATLAVLWTAGLLLQLGLTLRQLVEARRIVRGAEPVEESWITALFAELRERLGVRRADLLASPEVETPQVTGTWRPRVLLPRREIGRLSEQELALTLGHELLHVRRGDLWLGWVPALAQRLFFFHPLAALAAREYAVAREAACDAAVLRVLDPAPETYGRLLLRLGVTPRVPLAAAGAAPTFQTLKRRLEMLQQASEKKRIHPGWWGLVALLAVMALIPFRMVAQESTEVAEAVEAAKPGEPAAPAQPAEPGRPAQAAEPGRPAQLAEQGRPAHPAEPGRPAHPAHAAHPAPHAHPVPHAMPIPPAPPAAHPATHPLPRPVAVVAAAHPAPPPPPPAPPTPPAPPREKSGYRYSYSDHGDGESYILLYDGGSVTMNGSTSDLRKVKQISGGKPLLWFERDGKSYVVQDAATLARIQELFEPQREMGEKQGALGEKQAKLGEQQARLGAQMGELGAQQASHGARMAAQAMNANNDAAVAKIEADMEARSDKMEALGRQMEELGEKQEALGRQQEELGRQQEKLGLNAERQLRTVIDQALANGLAQEVDG